MRAWPQRSSYPEYPKGQRVGRRPYNACASPAARSIFARRAVWCMRCWAAFRDIVFRSLRFPSLGRSMEDYGLSDRESTDASDRAVDSRGVLMYTNDRL